MTLIETVVALAIIGITFLVIIGAISTNMMASAYQRESATAETLLRQVAEAQKVAPYAACDTSTTTSSTMVGPVTYTSAVVSRRYWDGATAFLPPPCGTDKGIQLIRVQVTSSDGRAKEFVDVVKRQQP